MPTARACALILILAWALTSLQAASGSQSGAQPAVRDAGEVRALWVLRTSLTSPAAITAVVRTAREHGFNTLLVQVRGRGDAYFANGLEPRAADLARQPAGFDPLAAILQEGREAGLNVHAWVNVNLVSSAVDLPIARTHLVYRHPEWLMVPREIAQDLWRVDPKSPAYVGRLARWTRAQDSVEGLYASPAVPAAAAHAEAVVRDIARRYAVDGIHLDYARYPSARFDYSRGALTAFKAAVGPTLSWPERRDLNLRERVDALAYPDALPEAWREFRIARMTALMERLRDAVRSERPSAIVSVAAAPDAPDARAQKLQDWGAWVRAGTVDVVCPMAYTLEPSRFAQQIAEAQSLAGERAVWAGIGAWRLTAAQTVQNIQTARRLGTAGIALFSYDSLVDPRQAAPNYLAIVGRSAFAASAPSEADR